MATFADTWMSIQGIDGWLTEGQARMLYEAAAALRPGEAIVEIGSHHGRSTIILGTAKPAQTLLLAVDPYGDPRWGGGEDALGVFQANLADHALSDEVQLARQLGAQAGQEWAGPPVGLLFVDGAHDYPSVDADLRAWMPHLSPTATVLMHDAFSSPGVTQVAFRRMFGSHQFTYIGSSRSLIGFSRSHPNNLGRAVSCARMIGKLPWMARNLAIKVAHRRGWSSVPPLLGHRDTALPY